MKLDLSKKINQWLILLLLSFIWGSSFILMKYGLKGFSNYHLTSLRITFSFLLLLPAILKNISILKRKELKWFFMTGWLGTGIPTFLYATSQMHIESAVAGMINSMTPLFTLAVGMIWFYFTPRWINVAGILIGLLGAFGLMLTGKNVHDAVFDMYVILLILAPLCYGFNINLIKSKLTGYSGLLITSFGFLFIGPVAILHLVFSDYSYIENVHSIIQPLIFIFILAAFGTVLALIIFNSLIKHTTPIFSSSVTYIIPVFAIMWGIFDGEKITVVHIVGIISILVGVYLVNRNNIVKG